MILLRNNNRRRRFKKNISDYKNGILSGLCAIKVQIMENRYSSSRADIRIYNVLRLLYTHTLKFLYNGYEKYYFNEYL